MGLTIHEPYMQLLEQQGMFTVIRTTRGMAKHHSQAQLLAGFRPETSGVSASLHGTCHRFCLCLICADPVPTLAVTIRLILLAAAAVIGRVHLPQL